MPHAAEPRASGEGLRNSVAVLGSGLLLGWIITLMELIEQPMAGTGLTAAWVFLSAKGIYWMSVGVVWALVAHLAEPRFGTVAIVLLGLVLSVAMSVALLMPTAMSRLAWSGARGSDDSTMGVLPMDARLAHLIWTNAFYGGLYLAIFTGVRRAARSRKTLARVQQARDQSAMLLEEGQLEAFRRRRASR